MKTQFNIKFGIIILCFFICYMLMNEIYGYIYRVEDQTEQILKELKWIRNALSAESIYSDANAQPEKEFR